MSRYSSASNTEDSTRVARLRGRLCAAGLAVLITLGSLSAASPASAARVVNRSGTVGAVSLNGPMIKGIGQMSMTWKIRHYQTAGFTARRSAASAGPQLISASYMVQQWHSDGSGWQNYLISETYQGTVSGAGSFSFPAWHANAASEPSFPAYYRIVASVIWSDIATGKVLGYESILPSRVGDAVCASVAYMPCSSSAGYINW